MSIQLTFLGAAGTVTGSKYLISDDKRKILVDAGLFQGERHWREKNWDQPPVDLSSISAVLLTHAHLDHVGMLPRYYRLGLRCPVFCTKSTLELAQIVLPDSGRLQEEEVDFRRAKGKSRHKDPQALYTEADAKAALTLLKHAPFNNKIQIMDGVWAEWTPMGHILGAAGISLSIGGKQLGFSGDIGRYNVPIHRDPQGLKLADLLLMESTYGGRDHPSEDPKQTLAEIVNHTVAKKGTLLVPSFAIGRTQLLLYYLRELQEENIIPDIPVIIDSPMATDATEVYSRNPQDYDEELLGIVREHKKPFQPKRLHYTTDRNESKRLNSIDQSMIIIAGSGMLNGGRILHHLYHRVSDARNTVLLVGYQPPGGRGDWMRSGAKSMRIFGEERALRAEVKEISGLSAHADRHELMRWCRSCSGVPAQVYVVHGESEQAAIWRNTLVSELGWKAEVAQYLQKIEL